MKLIVVESKSSVRDFHRLPNMIYAGDDQFVCPLIPDVESVFDPNHNTYFKHGEVTRWVLYDDGGKPIGRVAAFINRNKAYTFSQPTGGMGFFECIDSFEAASMLFDVCKAWLAERGMEAMDGPVNFGENDQWWGLHVEGFTTPSYGMNYHKPYYRALFEKYGFRVYFEQDTHEVDLSKPFPERFWKIAEWVLNRPGFSFRHFSWDRLDEQIRDHKKVYDQAWQFHEGFTPLDPEVLRNMINTAKPILEKRFVWIAYHEDEPVGIFAMVPDLNTIIGGFDGKLTLFNKLRLLLAIRRKKLSRAKVLIMGMVPKFQRSGIESAFFWLGKKALDEMPNYKEIEISWVGDFNPKMMATLEAVNATFTRKHITFRKLFDENAEFRRANSIPEDTREKYLKGKAGN